MSQRDWESFLRDWILARATEGRSPRAIIEELDYEKHNLKDLFLRISQTDFHAE